MTVLAESKTLETAPFRTVLRAYRWRLLALLGLVVIRQAAWLVEPSVFGVVLDTAVGHHKRAESLEHLVYVMSRWLGVLAVNGAAGVSQRFYMERVMSQLYGALALSLFAQGRLRRTPATLTAARVELSKELVTFLDSRLPDLVAGAINVVGVVVALYAYDHRIATACLLLTVPLALIARGVHQRMAPEQAAIHARREATFDVFSNADESQLRAHFAALAAAQQRVAKLSSINFGVLRGVLMVIFVAVLYIAIDLDRFSTGKLYAIVSYLWTFMGHAEEFPTLVESWSSLRDLTSRSSTDARAHPVAQDPRP